MDFKLNFGTILVVVVCFTSIISGQDVCTKTGPCTCHFPNGTGIDLTPTEKTSFFIATDYKSIKNGTVLNQQFELTTYYFHPCYDLDPKLPITNSNDTCNTPLALCRHVDTLALNPTDLTYKKDIGLSSFLGSANTSIFSAQGNSIIYGNKPSFGSVVLLVCAETDDRLHVSSEQDPADLELIFYSRSACLKQLVSPEEGRSVGSTLLIIFFSLVIFYLVLGVCTKKFLMGATGVEVIPNLGFWTDLPNLVKDGWAFAINGFKLPARGPGPVTSPDPNSYDSI